MEPFCGKSIQAIRTYTYTHRFKLRFISTTFSKEVQPTNSNIFKTVKNSVTTREAAEACGLVVSRNGMTCCPFHNDRHPSMKVDERFHCFACGADGDVIDFISRYYGVRPLEAAYSLAADFGVPLPEKNGIARQSPSEPRPRHISRDDATRYFATLTDYIAMLNEWQSRYAPTSDDAPVHPRFTAALQKLGLLRHIQDVLLTGEKDEQEEAAMILKENYERFQRELTECRKENPNPSRELPRLV